MFFSHSLVSGMGGGGGGAEDFCLFLFVFVFSGGGGFVSLVFGVVASLADGLAISVPCFWDSR